MQGAIVAIIVACAAWAVIKRYAPQSLRRAARKSAAAAGRRLGWAWLEQRFNTESAVRTDACSTCGGCASGKAGARRPMATPESLKRTLR